MKQLLITGFELFGGEERNPSWDAVARLPECIGDYQLTKLRIPVVFGEAADLVTQAAKEISADAILCLGLACGRAAVTPELVGINLRHAIIPDNSGRQPQDEPIIENGQAAFFSTIPVRAIAEAIQAKGIPAQVSYSAGAYVCNDLLYTLLARFEHSETKVGFLHVPYCTEQNKTPALPLQEIVDALTIAIEQLN